MMGGGGGIGGVAPQQQKGRRPATKTIGCSRRSIPSRCLSSLSCLVSPALRRCCQGLPERRRALAACSSQCRRGRCCLRDDLDHPLCPSLVGPVRLVHGQLEQQKLLGEPREGGVEGGGQRQHGRGALPVRQVGGLVCRRPHETALVVALRSGHACGGSSSSSGGAHDGGA